MSHLLQMLLLFLLVFSSASAAEEAGGQEVRVRNGTSEVTSDGWQCPNTTVKMTRGQEIHCHCVLAHTLRSVYPYSPTASSGHVALK